MLKTPKPPGSSPLHCGCCRRRRVAQGTLLSISDSAEPVQYVGAYGKLIGFLRECHKHGHIDDDVLLELLEAVESVGGDTEPTSTQTAAMFHRAATMGTVKDVLQAYGMHAVATEKYVRPENVGTRGVSIIVANDEVISQLTDPAFNPRDHAGGFNADLRIIVGGLVAPNDLVGRYGLNLTALYAFLEAVADQYVGNPYHNWAHAVDVFQFSHMALTTGDSAKLFTFSDLLALLMACLGHDVAHPGTNNAFQVCSESEIALVYNDSSPLENLHASRFFATLRLPGLNFLECLSKRELKQFRSKVIDVILSTDMSRHFDLVDRLSAQSVRKWSRNGTGNSNASPKSPKSAEPLPPAMLGLCRAEETQRRRASVSSAGGGPETTEDTKLLLQVFVHMADLGHCLRPWRVHRRLVCCLEEEFFLQGDKERELGLDVMPMMDRNKASTVGGQRFFLESMVKPLMDPWCSYLTTNLAGMFQENLRGNLDTWEELKKRHNQRTAVDTLRAADLAEGQEDPAICEKDVAISDSC